MAAAKLMTTIRSLLLTPPDDIRSRYDAMSTPVMAESLSRCRNSADLAVPGNSVLRALKTFGIAYPDLHKQGKQMEEHISILIDIINPHVSKTFGCGSVMGADLIVSVGDSPSGIHSERALAHLRGVAPIPASSGRTQRHRLNRGGDRRMNSALNRFSLLRIPHVQRTRDYIAKQAKEGVSKKRSYGARNAPSPGKSAECCARIIRLPHQDSSGSLNSKLNESKDCFRMPKLLKTRVCTSQEQ